MTFDIDDRLKAATGGYDEDKKRRAKQDIRNEFARLEQLQPTLDAYQEIANRQAREIASLSVALEAAGRAPLAADLTPGALIDIEGLLWKTLREFEEELSATTGWMRTPDITLTGGEAAE